MVGTSPPRSPPLTHSGEPVTPLGKCSARHWAQYPPSDHLPSSWHPTSSGIVWWEKVTLYSDPFRTCNLLSYTLILCNAIHCMCTPMHLSQTMRINATHRCLESRRILRFLLNTISSRHWQLAHRYITAYLTSKCQVNPPHPMLYLCSRFYLTNQRLLHLSLIEFIDIRFGPSHPVSSSALYSA